MIYWGAEAVLRKMNIYLHTTKSTANYSQEVTDVPSFPVKVMKVLSPCQKAQPVRFSLQHLLLQTFDVHLTLLSPRPLISSHSMCPISWKQPVSSNYMGFNPS